MDITKVETLKDGPRPVELCEASSQAPSGPPLLGNLHVLNSVPLSLSVVLGQASVTLGELMALRQSQILSIDREVDAAIDIMLDGHVVARGRLMVAGDQFGIRICETAALVT